MNGLTLNRIIQIQIKVGPDVILLVVCHLCKVPGFLQIKGDKEG